MTGRIEIRAAESAAAVRAFIDVPFRILPREVYPNWVPPLRVAVADALDQKRNPFYARATRALFIAYRDGRVAGRIAAIENAAHNAFHADRTGFFGFFECIDDAEVARELFGAAERWLGARGLTSMCGPMNPSTNQECGLLVKGFENRPTFMTAWNPPYYDALCEAAGLAKCKDLLGFWFSVEGEAYQPPPFLERQVERALKGGRMTFRDIDLRRFDRDVAICWEIYNDAWEKNWGFVPMSHAEFLHAASDLKMLLRPEWSFIAYVNDEPAGFMLATPDYNEVLRTNRSGRLLPFALPRMLWFTRRAKTARVLALGTKAAFRSRSILALFSLEIMRRGRSIGGTGAEASWLLEDNQLIVKPMRAMGATERMVWRIYERPLDIGPT